MTTDVHTLWNQPLPTGATLTTPLIGVPVDRQGRGGNHYIVVPRTLYVFRVYTTK